MCWFSDLVSFLFSVEFESGGGGGGGGGGGVCVCWGGGCCSRSIVLE